MDFYTYLEYNPLMFSSLNQPATVLAQAAQIPQQAVVRAMHSLSKTLSPGLVLGLAQCTGGNTPRELADELILRSTCQLRQLRAAVPKLRLDSQSNQLMRTIHKLRHLRDRGTPLENARSHDELALAQALFELYLGLVLRMLSAPPHKLAAVFRASTKELIIPCKLVLIIPTRVHWTHLKRPRSACLI